MSDKQRLIAIRAGHDIHDSGAVAKTGQKESRTNMNVANSAVKYLKSWGFTNVRLVRLSHDQGCTINDGMTWIRKNRPFLFVGIHHNGGPGDGAEVCVQVNNKTKTYDDNSRKLAGYVLNEFKVIGQNLRPNPYVALLNKAKTGDYLGELRACADLGITGIYTEFGFMTTNDVQAFDTLTEQDREGYAIALAIKKYLDE